ncbi:Something about silencing protein 10 [Orchesella cincta]|uniref:Something about silencing protein 10 n=1 Tax=Orchesella cincta TaxID=48709 RepID=A0A1D2N1N7_ORCCI|nr:Something about silencing protein 10 [Orchesella cincta]
MGKRRVGFKKAKNSLNNLQNAGSSEDEDQIETRLESLLDDEIDQYNSLKEKTLLEKGKKAKGRKAKAGDSDEEEEVYGLDLSSDEEETGEGAEKMLEDSADEEDDDNDDELFRGNDAEDGIPDSRAWGKKARIYHDTDYVDQDFGGFEGEDAEMAEQEEAEAKEIQKRLTAELDDDDFLGLVPAVVSKPKKAEKGKEILKVDFDTLSVADKRKLIQRECPEVVHLLDEYKEKLAEAKTVKAEIDTQSSTFLRDFYVTKYHTIMNYCINISYFLYLRATSPTNCKGHPVIKRILQFRRLLDELNTFNPEKYLKSQEASKKTKPKKSSKSKAKASAAQASQQQYERALAEQMDLGNNEAAGEDSGAEETLEKRGINYTIAKNKGLTPYRKKELRNPRVKHRMKFRKATVRRKGQVRTPRTETRKYDGELTGIKMNVSKSIKFK